MPREKTLNTSRPFFLLITIRSRRWILGLILHPTSLNKTRNLTLSHLTALLPFPPCHLTALPSFPPSHFTTLLPTIKTIQNNKLGLLSLTTLVFNNWFLIKIHNIEISMEVHIPPPENDCGKLNLKSNLLTIRPLRYAELN